MRTALRVQGLQSFSSGKCLGSVAEFVGSQYIRNWLPFWRIRNLIYFNNNLNTSLTFLLRPKINERTVPRKNLPGPFPHNLYDITSTPACSNNKHSHREPNEAKTTTAIYNDYHNKHIPSVAICANLAKSATKPQKWFWKFFFEHTFGVRFFSLFVVYIREIRSWTGSIEWYTFSRTTSYFLRKWQKKPFSSNLSH